MLENQAQRIHGASRFSSVGKRSSTVSVRDPSPNGRQLVRDLQQLLAERQQLVVRLRQAAACGDTSTTDLAEGLAHLTTRHDALLDRLARMVPPAGAPFHPKRPAA